MDTNHHLIIRVTFIAAFFLACGISQHAQAQKSPCLSCHQEVEELAADHLYVHRPVREQQCHACHDNNSTKLVLAQQLENTTQVIVDSQPKKIEWLAESFVENKHQVALLPTECAGKKLTLKLWYENRQKKTTEIQCPDMELLQKKQPQPPPTIKQLHLHDHNELLLSRATLSWTTATPCQCRLIYRYTGHEYSEAEDDFYALDHTLEIRNFNPNATSVMVSCIDTSQQQANTKYTPLNSIPFDDHADELSVTSSSTELTTQFRLTGNLIEFSITTAQPAMLAIGRVEGNKKSNRLAQPSPRQVASIDGEDHITLTNKEQLNTKICFKCHGSTVERTSHPINVLPPPGMIIPPEYPLLDNGRLTCMTCHQHHSSNNEARLLKKSKKELCTGCHTHY